MHNAARTAALAAALAVPALGGCATGPFDANAQWKPTQKDRGTSYAGTALASRSDADADTGAGGAADAKAATEVPEAGGENPWATPLRNPIVEVCYGALVNTPAALTKTARERCPDTTQSLERLGHDSFWNGCPLLQPKRVAFRCVTDPAAS